MTHGRAENLRLDGRERARPILDQILADSRERVAIIENERPDILALPANIQHVSQWHRLGDGPFPELARRLKIFRLRLMLGFLRLAEALVHAQDGFPRN